MAIIGSLGDFYFEVSQDVVNTLDNMSWKSSASFGEHNKHLGETLIEFVGNDVETITFDIFLSAFLGVNPIKQISAMLQAKRKGLTMPLIIGTKGYGTYRWVIQDISSDFNNINQKGDVLIMKAAITLNSYASR